MTNKTEDVAKVVSVLQESFGPEVALTVHQESANVFVVKATAADDADLDAGRRTLAARARDK